MSNDEPKGGAIVPMIVLGTVGALIGFGSHGDAQHAALGAGIGAIVALFICMIG